jgi:hypothetical protein
VGGSGIEYNGAGTITITNNIIWTKMNMYAAFMLVDSARFPVSISNNIHWDGVNGPGNANWKVQGVRKTFAEWVAVTSETNSQEIDPKLKDPATLDLTLQDGSPALGIGANLDLSTFTH